jgi:hypothetical protein
MAKKDDDYEVGYKKPPRETQFKPGQSGNPKGRPKERKNFKTELLEELHERIAVKEGGAHRKVTKQRAMLKSLTAKALHGDTKAAAVIVNMVYRLLDQDEDDVKTPDLSAEDLDILNDFEIRPRPQDRVRRRTPPPTKEDSTDD